MNDLTTLRQGRRLSSDFVLARTRTRILDALAGSIVAHGYSRTTVAHIVRRAGIARNTFYETFGSKADAATALVAEAFPTSEQLVPSGHPGLDLFVIEAAVAKRSNASLEAGELIEALERLCDMRTPSADESLLCTLPPGKHGLTPEFVSDNQRRRLLLGFSGAVTNKGFPGVTIADMTSEARLSRRTFYEHFGSGFDVGAALLDQMPLQVPSVDPGSGDGALAVEVCSYWCVGQNGPAVELVAFARKAHEAVGPFALGRVA